MPDIPLFVNNLAGVLAVGPDADLPRALATINPVIARWPAERRFRETRGQILARMARWEEALPDLEAALAVYPDSRALHRTLAEAYEHLDAPGLAAEHRRRAELLRTAAGPEAAPDAPNLVNSSGTALSPGGATIVKTDGVATAVFDFSAISSARGTFAVTVNPSR
jgi:hypothetical protein